MPLIVVSLFLLLLISIILIEASRDYLIVLATTFSMILPPPVPPIHTKSSMLESDSGCSPPPNLPILKELQSYQTLPDLMSNLQTVPKKIPILTCLATDRLALHITSGHHTTRPNIRPTIPSITDVPEIASTFSATSPTQYSLDQVRASFTDSDACATSVRATSHIIKGTAENLSLARIDSDRSSDTTYFDADTDTPENSGLSSLDADSYMDIYVDMDTGSSADFAPTDAENQTPGDVLDNILAPLAVLNLLSDLQGADLDTRKAAASAIKCLSLTPDTAQLIATSCLRPLVDLIFSGDDEAISLAARFLRDISAALPEKQRQLMVDARVIPAMVEILSFCNIHLCRQHAVETLCNLTRGTAYSDGIRRLVVVEGGFKKLIRSLSRSGPYEVEAEALRYIAPAAPVPVLLSQGIVPLMVHVLRHESPAARQVIAVTIPSLPRSNRLQAAFGKSGAMHLLTRMLDEDLAASHEAAARALCCLLRCNRNLDIVRKNPACIAGLVRMLRSSTVKTGLVPAIGSLLHLVPILKCREEMLALGAIEALKDLNVQIPGAQKLLRRLEGGTWMEKVLCLA